MTKGKIYLIDDKTGSRVEYEESGYVAETYLQEFIQQYPDLLPGDQRGGRDQPGCLRHLLEAAGDDRVGVRRFRR